MIEYKEFGLKEFDKIKEIYQGEGWSAYLRDDEGKTLKYFHVRGRML